MYMTNRPRSLVDFLTWLVGFLVSLFTLLSPLRDPLVYSSILVGFPKAFFW